MVDHHLTSAAVQPHTVQGLLEPGLTAALWSLPARGTELGLPLAEGFALGRKQSWAPAWRPRD